MKTTTKQFFSLFSTTFRFLRRGKEPFSQTLLGPAWPYLCVVSRALKGICAHTGLIHTGSLCNWLPFQAKREDKRYGLEGLEAKSVSFLWEKGFFWGG